MTEAESARIRRLGLDETVATPALLRELRPDCLGLWLPWAMASLYAAVVASTGAKAPDIEETLRAWTLSALADSLADTKADAALDVFRSLPDGNGAADVTLPGTRRPSPTEPTTAPRLADSLSAPSRPTPP